MLRQEMDIGYGQWIHRPGEKLGVLDNAMDYDECKKCVHCNATHGYVGPSIIWDSDKRAYVLDQSNMEADYEAFNDIRTGRRHTIMGGGEHNNVYFPSFITYKETLPQCLMQTKDGQYLELHDPLIANGQGIPMPAIDDPTLISLNQQAFAMQAQKLCNSQYVACYVLGSEMLYPEYFGLGSGDFRPDSWTHFEQWCQSKGIIDIPTKDELTANSSSYKWLLWHRFREQAMADRCAAYYQAVLLKDEHHLVYYPTHGSTMSDTRRSQLGQQPESLACACDGIEMGHILIQDDKERRNILMTTHYTSFGAPVIIPRLGNKQPDLSAIGGGRSFTPETLRRLFYECVGMGISIIFPIHWMSRLHDGEWFIKDTPAEATCREIFDEMTSLAPFLQGMGRLQPQVGVLAGDGEWFAQWNPRWTGLMQDALTCHDYLTLIADSLIDENLPHKMPVLIIADNGKMLRSTLVRLQRYLEHSGKLIIWGKFAAKDEHDLPFTQSQRLSVLDHTNAIFINDSPMADSRILRELFLSGPEHGIDGPYFEYQPIPYAAIRKAILQHAPDCVLQPAQLSENAQDVNVYPLTDRESLCFVLINHSSEEKTVTLTPDPHLLPSYSMAVLPENKQTQIFNLVGHATLLCWCHPKYDRAQTETTVLKAEKAYEQWKHMDFNVQALRTHYSIMRSGELWEKRQASANLLLHALVLKPDIYIDADYVHIRCTVTDTSLLFAKGAHVCVRFTPGSFERFMLQETENDYRLDLPLSQLPKFYDHTKKTYEAPTRILRAIFQAECGALQGGMLHTVKLGTNV